LDQIKARQISSKLNGATGNYNAHHIAYPEIDWPAFTIDFINNFNKKRLINLEPNLLTTQIEPHDSYAELFDNIKRLNTILIDFSQDIWRYISDGWFTQSTIKGEVGSSTMPHKVNPIDFENSEGNLGLANSLFEFFSRKLPISRLQRDLSDSTVLRNIGVAFSHSLIAYKSLLRGLKKIIPNREEMASYLESRPEIIAEAIQTILRREGHNKSYEKLKELTRGKKITLRDFYKFIENLEVGESVREELRKITPLNYTGIAEDLC
jgi:adenylosuccinate lyase